MNRQLERTTFLVIIASLGGVIAGLVLSQTLAATLSAAQLAAPAPAVAPVGCDCPAPEPPEPQAEPTNCENFSIPQLTLYKTQFAPGESLGFFVGDGVLGGGAWVGLIPSSVPHGDEATNDANDVDYRYVTAGTSYQMTAPSDPGTYDLRLHNQYPNGVEVGHLTLIVE